MTRTIFKDCLPNKEQYEKNLKKFPYHAMDLHIRSLYLNQTSRKGVWRHEGKMERI